MKPGYRNLVGVQVVISAIVLAAGLSTRMERPKQLLPFGEHTVIEQVVSVLLESPVDEVLVVTGHERGIVESTLSKWPVRTVFNPDYAQGEMLSSVKAGLRAAAFGCQAALLTVGDMPAIERNVVAQIIQAYQSAGRDVVCIPSYQMRAGHPVLVPHSYWEAILSLPRGDTLRSVLRARSAHVRWVVVDTPSVLRDMDTPADYKQELELRHRQE